MLFFYLEGVLPYCHQIGFVILVPVKQVGSTLVTLEKIASSGLLILLVFEKMPFFKLIYPVGN